MKANYRNLLLQGNEWIDGSDEYGLILTDDLDSLLSCSILKQIKGCDVDVVYNVAMPVAGSEMIANLKALQEMGAVSVDTIMEKVDLVSDPEVEKVRLQNEKSVVNPSDTVGIE